ncbi:enhancer of mRNA decapping [Podochytrium sp. JEL0797]|nr:enhancer of mRNA decapping [Podochytrium sp. JEL0797]
MDFVGLQIQLQLSNGQTIRGVVSSAGTGVIVIDGQHFASGDIVDLQVLAKPPPQPKAVFMDPAIVAMGAMSPASLSHNNTRHPGVPPSHSQPSLASPAPRPKPTQPKKTQAPAPSAKLPKPEFKPQRKGTKAAVNPPTRNTHHSQMQQATPKKPSTIHVEPAVDISQDFDFQSSLDKFDKHRVFAEIRASEEGLGDSESGGGMGGFRGQERIGHKEMVLDSEYETGNDEREDGGDEDDYEFDDGEEDLESFGELAFKRLDDDYDSNTTFPSPIQSASVPRRLKRPVFKSVGGVAVYGVTGPEMSEVERIAVTETGPNETQMIENAGRGAAMIVMQALGGSRRIKVGNHNSAPTVVVMCGNNRVGSYGLCTARHLANHDINVVVCVVGGEAELVNTVSYQRKIYLPTGGKIVKHVAELPQHGNPVDLIIDALLGSIHQILDLNELDRASACDLMKWANENRANVLSLDIPSGINAITGIPTSPAHHVKAKWTLSFGLPKACLAKIAREIAGELFLADIGIPKIVFQKLKSKAGVVGKSLIRYVPPFGDKFVVGLVIAQ